MDRLHEMNREQDNVVLELRSWFVPMGWITKVRYLQHTVNLLKLKRGFVGGRVFWSGVRDIAGSAAMDSAKAGGMQTIEMTFKGKLLKKLTYMTSSSFTKPL